MTPNNETLQTHFDELFEQQRLILIDILTSHPESDPRPYFLSSDDGTDYAEAAIDIYSNLLNFHWAHTILTDFLPWLNKVRQDAIDITPADERDEWGLFPIFACDGVSQKLIDLINDDSLYD